MADGLLLTWISVDESLIEISLQLNESSIVKTDSFLVQIVEDKSWLLEESFSVL